MAKDTSKKQMAQMKSAEAFAKKQAISQEALIKVQERITEGQFKYVTAVKEALKVEEKLFQQKSSIVQIERQLIDLTTAALKPAQAIRDADKESLRANTDQAKQLAKQIKIKQAQGKLSAADASMLLDGANNIEMMNQKISQIQNNGGLRLAFSAGAEAAEKAQGAIDSMFAGLPGGDALKSLIGADKIGESIQQGLVTNLSKAGTKGVGVFGKLGAAARAFTMTLMANPILAIIAAVVILLMMMKKLVSLSNDFARESAKTAEAHGTSVLALQQMKMDAADVAYSHGNILADSKDILAVQGDVAKELGTSFAVSAELASNIAETGRAFGFGVEAAGKFTSALMQNGVAIGDTHQLLQDVGGELLGTGLNAGAVIEDMSENSKMIGKHFKGNVKQFKKAAIQAAKMGVSLKSMASVADALLDIEGSMTSQFEFQAMTGKQLNLDQARRLAMEGDLAGATASVLDQVGGIHELNKMDYFSKKKLAEATGMEVDELYKAARMKEMGLSLAENELAMLEKQGITVEQLHAMDSKGREAALAKMNDQRQQEKSMGMMKEQLMKSLIPIGESISSVLSELLPILEAAVPIIKIIGKVLGFTFGAVISPIKDMLKLLKTIGSFMHSTFVKPIENFIDLIYSGIGSAVEWIKSTFNGAMDVVGGTLKAPFNMLIGAMNMILKGLNMINVTIPSWVPFIGGKSLGFNIPQVPYLEKGGSVGETGLAVVHKGEVVIPEAQKIPQFDLQPLGASLAEMNAKTVPLGIALPAALAMALPLLTAAMTTAVIAGNTATALIPRPVLILNPVIPTLETNPMINAAAALEVATSGLKALFGSNKNSNQDIINGLDQVVNAIENIDINMDGEKIGFLTKVKDTFRRKR